MFFRSSWRVILILMLMDWTFWPTLSHSAEITCADVWPLPPQGVTAQQNEKNEEANKRRFPSGRRPLPGITCISAVFRGTIVKGDDEKLVRFYRANHPFLNTFLLISPGGNVEAAINIGRLFRKYLISAWAPEEVTPGVRVRPSGTANGQYVDWCSGQDCICASACALIWFGAVDRVGGVGLHRPTTEDPTFKALSPAEASTVYRRILSSTTGYLDEMEVPKPMVDAMVGTSSSEIRWVDSYKDGLRRPPSIAEWEDASCGSFTGEERSTYYALIVKTNKSPQERLFLKALAEKSGKNSVCEGSLLSVQRDQLASP